MSNLNEKVNQSIKLLKVFAKSTDEPIELSYSGGKDSDVILRLAQMAGINFRAIYKNTTIDPPGNIQHVLSNNVEMIMPERRFFELIAKNGVPTIFTRHCCGTLKEYKILNHAIHGIRRAESTKRENLYKEPEICRIYNKKDHVSVLLPILEWSNKDVQEFVISENIQCPPLYYENGKFDVSKRLGCLGCPLNTDRIKQFKKYPKLIQLWINALKIWFNSRTEKSTSRCRNVYDLMAAYLFFEDFERFEVSFYHPLFKQASCKQLLEDYFKIDLL